MRIFNDRQDAIDYAVDEILATLQDDLNRMEWAEAECYTDADREELAARIADIRAVEHLLRSAPALLEALQWQAMADADPAAALCRGYFDRARELRRAALAKAR